MKRSMQFSSILAGVFTVVALMSGSMAMAANVPKGAAASATVPGKPVLTVSPVSVDFGPAGVNEFDYSASGGFIIFNFPGGYSIKGNPKGIKAQIFQIKNTGNGPLTVDDAFAIFSPDACRKLDNKPELLCDFGVTANTCPKSLGAGGTCSLTVEFIPFRTGKLQTTLTLGGASQNKVTIQLSGTGVGNSNSGARAAGTTLNVAPAKGDISRGGLKHVVIVSVKDTLAALGQPAKLRATVKSKTDGTSVAGVDVRFKVSGKTVGTAKTGQDGIASYDYCADWTLTPGANAIEADAIENGLYAAGKGTGSLGVLRAVTSLSVVETGKFSPESTGVNIYGGAWKDVLPLSETGSISVRGYLQVKSSCVIDMLKFDLSGRKVVLKSAGVNKQALTDAQGQYLESVPHQIGKTEPVSIEVSFDGDGKLLPSATKVVVK